MSDDNWDFNDAANFLNMDDAAFDHLENFSEIMRVTKEIFPECPIELDYSHDASGNKQTVLKVSCSDASDKEQVWLERVDDSKYRLEIV